MHSAKRVVPILVCAVMAMLACSKDEQAVGPDLLVIPDPANLLITKVVLTPSSVTLDTGQTQQFTARGVRMIGDTVPITASFSATGGSIASDGLYTAGRAAGSYRVIAHHPGSGKADTSAVSIIGNYTPPPPAPPPSPSPAPGPSNEPAGFIALVERPFNSLATTDTDRGTGAFPNKTGGSEGWDGTESRYPLITVQSDPTAPNGTPSSVMRFEYPAQTVASGTTFAPGVAQTQGFDSPAHGSRQLRQLYVRYWFKLGSTFQNHTAGTKLMFFRSTEPNGQKFEPFMLVLGQPGYLSMIVNLQGTQDNGRGHLPANQNPGATDISNLRLDTWYKVEVHLQMNSAYGAADGLLRVWLDGILAMQYDDVRYLKDGVNPFYWGNVHIAPTWGGQGGTINNTFYWYLDHMYVSGR